MLSAVAALTLAAVLDHAGGYVLRFEQALASIVAEEHCHQDWKALPKGRRVADEDRRRDLVSDLLLVKLAESDKWLQFRDVFEVDGEPVRDRDDRLLTLFLDPAHDPEAQVAAILAEGARYNLGDIGRNVPPMWPLVFLEPRNQKRFKFYRSADRIPAVVAADATFRAAATAWVVRFEEKAKGTLVRTTDGKDLPSHGRFWIDPDTGRVLMTELIAEDGHVRATMIVKYDVQPELASPVPVAMFERYEQKSTQSIIEGLASYGHFRRFQVNVDERFLLKKQP